MTSHWAIKTAMVLTLKSCPLSLFLRQGRKLLLLQLSTWLLAPGPQGMKCKKVIFTFLKTSLLLLSPYFYIQVFLCSQPSLPIRSFLG